MSKGLVILGSLPLESTLPLFTELPRRRVLGKPPLSYAVISAGTKEDNEAMGISSPVVLDQHFAAERAFGAGGTPSAILVDEEGKIASEVVVGAPAVLELAGVRAET
jgi:hypothetical protein